MFRAKKQLLKSRRNYTILCKDIKIKCNLDLKGNMKVEETLTLQGEKGEFFERVIPKHKIDQFVFNNLSRVEKDTLTPLNEVEEQAKGSNEYEVQEDKENINFKWKLEEKDSEVYQMVYGLKGVVQRESKDLVKLDWEFTPKTFKHEIQNLTIHFDGPDIYELKDMRFDVVKDVHVVKTDVKDVMEMKEISFNFPEPILPDHQLRIHLNLKIADDNEKKEKEIGKMFIIACSLIIAISYFLFNEPTHIPKTLELDESYNNLSFGALSMLMSSMDKNRPEKHVVALLLSLNQKGHIKLLKTDDSRIQIHKSESKVPLQKDEKLFLDSLFSKDPKKSFASLEWNNLNAQSIVTEIGKELLEKGYYEDKSLLRNILMLFAIGCSLSFLMVKNKRISYSLTFLGIYTLYQTQENPKLSNLSKKGNSSRKKLLGYKKYLETTKEKQVFNSTGNIQLFDRESTECIGFSVFKNYQDSQYVERLMIELCGSKNSTGKSSPYLSLPFDKKE